MIEGNVNFFQLQLNKLSQEKADLTVKLEQTEEKLSEEQDKGDKLNKQKADLDNQVKDLQERLEDEENTNADLTNQKRLVYFGSKQL